MSGQGEDGRIGRGLTLAEIEKIAESVANRNARFPDDDLRLSVAVILANAGAKYAPVSCMGGEWKGALGEARRGHLDLPVCPAGHVLVQGRGPVLGWVADS